MKVLHGTRMKPLVSPQSVSVGEHKHGEDMLNLNHHHSGECKPDESFIDLKGNYSCHSCVPPESSSIQAFPSNGQHVDCGSAYFQWPTLSRSKHAPMLRENYFQNLHKGLLSERKGELPSDKQATTLLDLLTIRSFHSDILRKHSLGTALGYRIRNGSLTSIPAILAFVSHKVHKQWLSGACILPKALEGPGGIWCELDVVELAYAADVPAHTTKQQLYNDLIEGLTGSDPFIGSGSQVASQKSLGTIGPIVQSRIERKELGFLTSRHIAIDLEYPNQKMFHPLPPSHGPGVYLGSVGRSTTFVTDELWYGIFAAANPETFVRADGAFVPFAENFPIDDVKTSVKQIGAIGDPHRIDLQAPISSLIGREVMKVGRSSGLSTGTILAYALEYNDTNGVCYLSDLIIIGSNHQTFDLEGDSGSLVLIKEPNNQKPKPLAIICCGSNNRGNLNLQADRSPVAWTSAVDLGRLLDLLELDIITNDEHLHAASRDQNSGRGRSFNLFGIKVHSAIGVSNMESADQNRTEVSYQSSPSFMELPLFVHDKKVNLEFENIPAMKDCSFVEPEAKKSRKTSQIVSEE